MEFFLAIIFLHGVIHISVEATHGESRLFFDILAKRNYNRYVRPKETTYVNFGVSLQQIIEVNEDGQYLAALFWENYEWKDQRFAWNESEYDHVRSIRPSIDLMWEPDITLINGAGEKGKNYQSKTNPVVYSNGLVSWVPTVTLTAKCYPDLSKYPFDTQMCVFKYASASYNGHQVNLDKRHDEIDYSTYMAHGEWDLIDVPVNKEELYFPCCEEPYPVLTFNVTLKRRSHHHLSLYVTPTVLLGILTPFVFAVPQDHESKITLVAGLLLCMTIQVGSFQQLLPATDGLVSVFGRYLKAVYVLVAVSAVLTTLIKNLTNTKGGCPQPHWIIRTIFFGCIGKVCCIKQAQPKLSFDAQIPEDAHVNEEEDHKTGFEKEWHQIGQIMDRLFLIIFLIIIVLLSAMFLATK